MIYPAVTDDFPALLALAGEVEPLFGPMVEDEGFRQGLRQAILDGHVFCSAGDGEFEGGIIISPAENEILWFAVREVSRGRGVGRALLAEGLAQLDLSRPVKVVTFDGTVEAGGPARSLYRRFGFADAEPCGANPAGIPVVMMVRG